MSLFAACHQFQGIAVTGHTRSFLPLRRSAVIALSGVGVGLMATIPITPASGGTGLSARPSAAGLEITASPADPSTTLPATYKFRTHNGYTTKCQMDGGHRRACTSPKVYENLADGPHHFVVRAYKDGDVKAKQSADFVLDAAGPTKPVVTATPTTWTTGNVDLTATGSKTIGSPISYYQHRVSTDFGKTWSTPADGGGGTVTREGTSWVDFQAVDKLGRPSPWARGYARIDRTMPGDPTVTPGNPCTVTTFPATLTAKSTDAGSGAILYYWDVYQQVLFDWIEVDRHTGPTYTLPQGGTYDISVWAVDRAGNEGNDTEWVNDTC